MPASAEGIFRLLDRASGPLRRMEMQANRTDRAFARLALTMDAVGGNKQLKQLEETDRHLRQIDRSSTVMTRDNDRMGRSFRKAGREAETFGQRLRKAGANLISIGKVIQLMKLPAIAVAIGWIAQGIGALAGGLVSLLPKVADLWGVLAPLPAIIGGVGIAAAAAMVSFRGLGKAIQGDKAAMAALTPEARRFVTTMKMYAPVAKELRESAQKAMFPGLDYSLRRLQRGVPTAKQALGIGGGLVGTMATELSKFLTRPDFMRDFVTLSKHGASVMHRLWLGVLNIIDALRDFTIAARPFTNWLIDTIVGWTRHWKEMARWGRESGATARHMEQVKASMIRLGHVLRQLWTFFKGLGRAARPLGDDLWLSADRATKRWSDFANSVGGRYSLTRQFLAFGESIHSINRLLGDLGKALWRMGQQPGLVQLTDSLDRAIPRLEQFLNQMAQSFGPALASIIGEVLRLLGNLAGMFSPASLLIKGTADLLEKFNSLLEKVRPLRQILAAAFAVWTVAKFVGWVEKLTAALWGAARASWAFSPMVGGRVGAAAGTSAIMATAAAAGAGGYAATLPNGRQIRMQTPPGGGTLTGGSTRGALGALTASGGLFQGARAGLGAAARFVWPIAGIMGLFGAMSARREGNWRQQALQTLGGFGNTATFGLIPRMQTPTERLDKVVEDILSGRGYLRPTPGEREVRVPSLQARLNMLGGTAPGNLRQLRGQYAAITQTQRVLNVIGTPQAKEQAQALNEQTRALRINIKAIEDETKLRQVGKSNRYARQLLAQYGPALTLTENAKGGAAAFTQAQQWLLRDMSSKRLRLGGRVTLAQGLLKAESEYVRTHPEYADAYRKLTDKVRDKFKLMGDHVRIVNGQIVVGSEGAWRRLANALGTHAERGQQRVTTAFQKIRNQAANVLMAMGYSQAEARALIARAEGGGGANITRGSVGAEAAASPGRMGPRGGPKGGPRSRMGGVGAGVTSVAQALMQRFPLSITSGLRPGDAGSFHSIGAALDLAGPPGVMNAAAAYIMQSGLWRLLAEGIHNPGLSIKNGQMVPPGFWGAATWAGHADHLHLAMLGGKPVGALPYGGLINLSAPAVGSRGLPGAIEQSAANGFAAGLSKRLNTMPWFGQGGSFRARRPMLIGVGDRDEDVTIRPRSGRKGGGMSVSVSIGKIDYRGPGDIKDTVKREVARAFEELSYELGMMPMTGTT